MLKLNHYFDADFLCFNKKRANDHIKGMTNGRLQKPSLKNLNSIKDFESKIK